MSKVEIFFSGLSQTGPYTIKELHERLDEYWAENLDQVPAEFDPTDMLRIAISRNWIRSLHNGRVTVQLPVRK